MSVYIMYIEYNVHTKYYICMPIPGPSWQGVSTSLPNPSFGFQDTNDPRTGNRLPVV